MPTLDRVTPYLESLFEDDDVKNNLRRAGARFAQAKSRAGSKRSRKAAAKDPRVWDRMREGAAYSFAAVSALRQAPERQAPSHRLRWALLVLALAAAAFVAYDERARTTVTGVVEKLRDAASSDGSDTSDSPVAQEATA